MALLAFACAACVLYALVPQEHMFSDGPKMLSMVRAGPAPHYNLLYVPFGYAFSTLVMQVSSLSLERALELYSAFTGSFGLLLTGLALRRLHITLSLNLCVLAFLALAPAALFFFTNLEVHGVQFLGAAWFFYTATRARESERPLLWLLPGAVVACAAHLTNVLLVPVLVMASMKRGAQSALRFRHLLVAGLFLLLLIDLADASTSLLNTFQLKERTPGQSDVMLLSFASEFVAGRLERGFFSWSEVQLYLQREFLAPGWLVLILCGCAMPLALRASVALPLATAFGTLLYLAVFTQGGVWERGAYYLSLYPLYAAVIAVGLQRTFARGRAHLLACALLILACIPQVTLALNWRKTFNQGITARDWARSVSHVVPPRSVVYTAELPRYFRLAELPLELEMRVIRKSLDQWPERHHRAISGTLMDLALRELLAGRSVYLDASMFAEDRERPLSVANFARVLDQELAKVRASRIPVPDAEGRLVLYRVDPIS